MAGKTPDQEPSIEEILASIRQIISDDEEPRDGAVDLSTQDDAARNAATDLSVSADDASRNAAVDLSAQDDAARNAAVDLTQGPEEKFVIPVADIQPEKMAQIPVDDIFDLTEEIKQEPKTINYAEDKFTIPVADTDEDRFQLDFQEHGEPEDNFMRSSDLDLSADSIFTNNAADATASAFSRLIGNMPVERQENAQMFEGGRITLEDIARDLMRPMLRQWISDNVPRLVERLVEKELEKLARQARDD